MLAIGLLTLVLVAVSTGDSVRAPRASAAGEITIEPVASGFTSPLGITNAGDRRLFITQQSGAIRIFDGTSVLPTPFLDVSGLISLGSERGLLGLAFHPGYPASPYFYIDYTDGSGAIVVARYRVSTGDANVADATSALILKTIAHPTNANHNGGQLAFGPDGRLYVGVGDGGGGGDVPNNAQNLSTLLGKILRLDVDGAPPYIAAGNPFIGTPGALGEIWAYGLRNPWRFSFDQATGDLLIGDVGQDSWEEVDFQPSASAGGQNYGWRLMEGNHCFNPPSGCDPGGLTAPILEYSHAAGDCAIIGGVRYRGGGASLTGTYLYGDFCTGRIWGAKPGIGGTWSSSELIDTPYLISSFGEDSNGEVYVSDLGGGGIYRVVPAVSVGGLAEAPDIAALPSKRSWPGILARYALAGAAVLGALIVAGRRRLRRNAPSSAK